MTVATATEMQNHFGYYLNLVMSGEEVIITKNGKEVGRLVPRFSQATPLTDSMMGILPASLDANAERNQALRQRYEMAD